MTPYSYLPLTPGNGEFGVILRRFMGDTAENRPPCMEAVMPLVDWLDSHGREPDSVALKKFLVRYAKSCANARTHLDEAFAPPVARGYVARRLASAWQNLCDSLVTAFFFDLYYMPAALATAAGWHAEFPPLPDWGGPGADDEADDEAENTGFGENTGTDPTGFTMGPPPGTSPAALRALHGLPPVGPVGDVEEGG